MLPPAHMSKLNLEALAAAPTRTDSRSCEPVSLKNLVKTRLPALP